MSRSRSADTAKVVAAAAKPPHAHAYPTPAPFDAYVKGGGYNLLKACIAGTRTRDDVIKIVSDAGLRGLGGAGFPTGRKWSLVRAEPAPRLFAVNCDEGEPGTFKDRYYLERDPHRFIEGMLIAAWVVEAADTYLYRPRRISGSAASSASTRSPKSKRRVFQITPGFICAAAPALISAAKNPR